MGFFKKVFGSAVEEVKKNLEDSKNEMLKNLEDKKNEMLKNLNEKKDEALGNLGIKSSSVFSSDDENVRVKIGTLTDGVLVIKEGFLKLEEDSLEDYKNLRKIVFPSTLVELEESSIDDQERLEELDFSNVTLLEEIPDNFIDGETRIKTFVVPEGVRTIKDYILGDAEKLKEVYIPESVTSIGCFTGNSSNSYDVYLYAHGLNLEDLHDEVKTFYVMAQDYEEYVEQLKDYESDARIRVMPDEKFLFYNSTASKPQNSRPGKTIPSKDTGHNSVDFLKTQSLEEEVRERDQALMKLWWVKDLEILYKDGKYALKYTGDKKKTTDYVYDDVAMLNEYQARIAQKQADGSMLYGVACTCGWSFLLTNCEYTKVTFLDGIGAVLAIDEDGDEYAIDRWGKPYVLEVYREKVEEDMNNNE